jgi:putative transposase
MCVHSLTFSCFSRRAFLSKDRSRMWLVEAIDRAREKHAFDLWA